ncbi:MAG: nitrile hydratase subunit beta [bacterium]|nr:nitrile hydratase subunit beta [bacterium]
MERPHDLGGKPGFGAIDVAEAAEPFHNEWEARVFAINRLLLAAGRYTLDEFRDAIERLEPHVYADASYYERWLLAIEGMTVEPASEAER